MKLTIKGKEYGLHFGLGAMEMSADIFERDPGEVFANSIVLADDTMDKMDISKEFVFGALLNWCDENDVKYEGTYGNFRNAFNDLTADVKKELLALYRKSIHNGRVVEDIFDEIIATYQLSAKEDDGKDSKKKVTRTRKSSKTSSDGGNMTIVE